MLGVEAFPSVIYFLLVMLIPESPRWLIMKNHVEKANAIMVKVGGLEHADHEYQNIIKSLKQNTGFGNWVQVKELFSKKMRLILIIGFGLAVFQQVSGINSVLYYAPMIFESAGSGRDAAFIQAIAIGLVFLVMTIVSMLIIDRFGRKPLLYIGVTMMALSLLITGIAFKNASYKLDKAQIEYAANEVLKLDVLKEFRKQNPNLIGYNSVDIKDGFAEISDQDRHVIRIDFSSASLKVPLYNRETFIDDLSVLAGQTFSGELDYYAAIRKAQARTGNARADLYLPFLLKESISINSILVLISILGFIAGFSLSLGPVMWAMFSEIFPNRLRGIAISIVGTVNSFTSFVVATFFPVQLRIFGSSNTFFLYAGFMFLCLIFIWKYVVETKGKSLEELELHLIR